MPQQVRGSATYPDAMKRDVSTSEQCFGFAKTARKATKREPTAKQRISYSALPTHLDGAWRWTTPKQARRARVHAPERNRTERLCRLTKQRHRTRRREARGNSRNDAVAMERCNAPGWNQTRITRQMRHYAQVSASHNPKAPSSARHPDAKKRDLPGCQNALANQRCPTSHRFRASPAARPPLRTDHGTTCQVAGIKNTTSRQQIPSIEKCGTA